jgi:hypothetical protein
MSTKTSSMLRIRWAAIGAVIAICLGAGGIGVTNAIQSDGERGAYTSITACRLLDTRPTSSVGGRTAPLGPGEILPVATTGSSGQCTGIPAGLTGVELNVTALQATGATHLTIWPFGDVPNASSLNPRPGQPPTPNAVTTRVHTDGTFRIFNLSNTVHVIVDLVGYYQDHNHDDRYLRNGVADSMTLGGGAFTSRQSNLEWLSGTACFRPGVPANGMRHNIPVTPGATITSVDVRTTASGGAGQFTVTVFAQRPGSTGGPTVAVQTFNVANGALGQHTLDLPDELADPGEALYLAFTPANNFTYLCAATVNFTRPGT